MKHKTMFVILVMGMSACTGTTTSSPTPEASATLTLEPTVTYTSEPSATATIEPTPTLFPTTSPPDVLSANVLQTNLITIPVPPGLSAISWNPVPGNPYDPNSPPALNGFPPHLLVSFDNEAVSPGSVNIIQRQIRIFPVQAYLDMYAQANEGEIQQRINQLQQFLSTKPPSIDGEIPVLPGLSPVQALHARVKYLNFSGGEGIVFLAHYAVDVGPVTNQSLVYLFQGFTGDGEHYISGIFPIDSHLLPENPESASQEILSDIESDPENYFMEITLALNDAAPTDFTPDLAFLEILLTSISISGTAPDTTTTPPPTTTAATATGVGQATQQPVTPSTPLPRATATPTPRFAGVDIVGIRWYWISLTESGGDEVTPPDPDRYFFQLNANGTIQATSDCNTGSGTFNVNRDRLSIDFTSGTDRECPQGSLTNRFFEELENAASYQLDGNRLTITLKNGSRMRFSR